MLESLPLDVLLSVLERLTIKERARFGTLSKTCRVLSVSQLQHVSLASRGERQLENVLWWLQALRQHSANSLRSLTLRGLGFTPLFWPDVFPSLQFPNLIELRLFESDRKGVLDGMRRQDTASLTQRTVRSLASLPTLQTLVASYWPLAANEEAMDAVHSLSDFAKLTNLTELVLYIPESSMPKNIELSKSFEDLTSLRKLDIQEAEVQVNTTLHVVAGRLQHLTLKSLVETDEIIAVPLVKKLEVYHRQPSPRSLCFQPSDKLRSLGISARRLPDVNALLANICTGLTALELEGMFEMAHLSNISNLKSLEKLVLCYVVPNHAGAILEPYLGLTRLTSLEVRCGLNGEPPVFTIFLQQGQCFPSLKTLHIKTSYNSGLGDIANQLPNLETLNFRFDKAEASEQVLASTSLQSVSIRCCQSVVAVAPNSVFHPAALILGDLPRLHTLRLDLPGCRTKDILALSSGLARLSALESFSFIHREVQERGVCPNSLEMFLASLRHLPHVETLELEAPGETIELPRAWIRNVKRLGICCRQIDFGPICPQGEALLIRTGPFVWSAHPAEDEMRAEIVKFRGIQHHNTAITHDDSGRDDAHYLEFYREGPFGLGAWEPESYTLQWVKRRAEMQKDNSMKPNTV